MRISTFRSPACWLYPLKPGREWKAEDVQQKTYTLIYMDPKFYNSGFDRDKHFPGNPTWRRRVNMVDLLIKVAGFINELNNNFNIKITIKVKWYFQYKNELIYTSLYQEVNRTKPSH
jgi:hypothetical protein